MIFIKHMDEQSGAPGNLFRGPIFACVMVIIGTLVLVAAIYMIVVDTCEIQPEIAARVAAQKLSAAVIRMSPAPTNLAESALSEFFDPPPPSSASAASRPEGIEDVVVAFSEELDAEHSTTADVEPADDATDSEPPRAEPQPVDIQETGGDGTVADAQISPDNTETAVRERGEARGLLDRAAVDFSEERDAEHSTTTEVEPADDATDSEPPRAEPPPVDIQEIGGDGTVGDAQISLFTPDKDL